MLDCYSFGNGIIGVILMGSMDTMESMGEAIEVRILDVSFILCLN